MPLKEGIYISPFTSYLEQMREREDGSRTKGRRESDEVLWHICQTLDHRQTLLQKQVEGFQEALALQSAKVSRNTVISNILLTLVLGLLGIQELPL